MGEGRGGVRPCLTGFKPPSMPGEKYSEGTGLGGGLQGADSAPLPAAPSPPFCRTLAGGAANSAARASLGADSTPLPSTGRRASNWNWVSIAQAFGGALKDSLG